MKKTIESQPQDKRDGRDLMAIGMRLEEKLEEKRTEVEKVIFEHLELLSQDRADHERLEDRMVINSSFLINKSAEDDFFKAMDELVNEGVTSFKLFMAYPGVFYSDDGQIVRAMQTAANNGSMIMMHAENGLAIDVLVSQALAAGNTDPKYHSLTRPWETEAVSYQSSHNVGSNDWRSSLHRSHVRKTGCSSCAGGQK